MSFQILIKIIGAIFAAQIATGNQQFNLELFNRAASNLKETENLVLSPTSAKLALGMVLAATADGGEAQNFLNNKLAGRTQSPETTLREFENLLAVVGMSKNPSSSCKNPNPSSQAEPPVAIHMANGLFTRSIQEPDADFLHLLRNQWQAEVQELKHFQPNGWSREDINQWVASQTNCRIKDLVSKSDITDDTAALLINAVFFKGTWQNEFKGSTQTSSFTTFDGEKSVKMMSLISDSDTKKGKSVKVSYSYDFENQQQVLKLPFKKKKDKEVASMFVILPDADSHIKNTISSISHESFWQTIDNEMRTVNADEVRLPKFKIKSKLDIQGLLNQSDPRWKKFFDYPEVTRITRSVAYIEKVVQKADIEVDEKGAEAAAATKVVIFSRSIGRKSVSFVADRPFAVAIRHNETGELLFMGIVKNPKY